MHAKQPTISAQSTSRYTLAPSDLIHWSGLAAMLSGILFILIQAVHPLDTLAAVGNTQWMIAHIMGVAMSFSGLLGITGIYARHAARAGWLGLIGYLLLSLFYALSLAFQFIEAFIAPLLVEAAPQFVEGLLGIPTGQPSAFPLGALPVLYMITGLAGYMLGGLLFGITIFRAKILPRWASGLLIAGMVLPLLAASFVPHPYDRIFAVIVGIALTGLGHALWAEKRNL